MPTNTTDGKSKVILWIVMVSAALTYGILRLLPIPAQSRTPILLGVFALFIGYSVTVSRLRMRIYKIGHDGENERAMQVDQRWAWLPGYGRSLKGILLFNAGRYHEAIDFVAPFAFDLHGNPRLATVDLYVYALALGNDGRLAEAQPYLENSISVSAKPDSFRVALAVNLLEQKKEPQRALQLLEQAMATPPVQSTAYGQQADTAKRTMRYAWALSSCGRKQDAETQIQLAFRQAAGLHDSDLADLHYLAGEALKAAGANANSRTEFEESLRLMPTGVSAIASKKALVTLD
jgi:tetratricopeptide (TPR) repeat protein